MKVNKTPFLKLILIRFKFQTFLTATPAARGQQAQYNAAPLHSTTGHTASSPVGHEVSFGETRKVPFTAMLVLSSTKNVSPWQNGTKNTHPLYSPLSFYKCSGQISGTVTKFTISSLIFSMSAFSIDSLSTTICIALADFVLILLLLNQQHGRQFRASDPALFLVF